MLTRMTLGVAVLGASLAVAAPALAAPSPYVPHARTVHAARHVSRLAAASTPTGGTEYVNNSTGSNTNANGSTNTCRLAAHPCATIQHAIDVANASGTIKVAAGTYPEQLTINAKNLTITGAGAGKTIIQPTSLNTDYNDPNDSSNPEAVIVTFTGTASGGLSNLTVDGSQTTEPSEDGCSLDYIGVEFANASGTLNTDTISGIQESSGYVGCQPGADGGVYVANDDSNAHAVTMNKLNVNTYDKDGITCVNVGTTCTITGSTVTGVGPTPLTAQNGIEIYQASAAKITGTTVTGNTYTSPNYDGPGDYYASASGILVYQAGALTLSGNKVNSNDVNVYALSDNADFAPPAQGVWSITGNTITNATDDTGQQGNPNDPGAVSVPLGSGVGDGLDLDGPNAVSVYGNTVTGNADWGIALFGTTNSYIGGTTTTTPVGKPNTVTGNGNDGIYVGEDSYDQSTNTGVANTTQPSTGNTIAYNTVRANQADGIYADGPVDDVQQDSGNTFQANQLLYNVLYNAQDLSTGTSGTSGTANTWTANKCTPAGDSNPSGLCAS